MKKIKVSFTTGYMGGVKAIATIGTKEHILDLDLLAQSLAKHIAEKGYTVSKTNRQKYPRLIIND